MAVRTGGPGAAGISLLLVPLKDTPGVTMRRLSVSGLASSGTTYIELDDVRVPRRQPHRRGEPGHALHRDQLQPRAVGRRDRRHEAGEGGAVGRVRVCLQAGSFGQPLVEQPVVRHRLAKAGALLESLTAWVEQFALMMTRLPHQQADVLLGGPTALLKAQAGIVFKESADTAVLLFGGNGYTRTGQGQLDQSESPIFPHP
jgi:acyl-CoA dehydrogenase